MYTVKVIGKHLFCGQSFYFTQKGRGRQLRDMPWFLNNTSYIYICDTFVPSGIYALQGNCIDGLVQERHDSNALAMKLHHSWTDPSTWELWFLKSLATQLYDKRYMQSYIKENIQNSTLLLFVRGSTRLSSQRASNAENISMRWHHRVSSSSKYIIDLGDILLLI